jgi:hypothetical protein
VSELLVSAQERKRRHEGEDVLVASCGHLDQPIDDDRRGLTLATNDEEVGKNGGRVVVTGCHAINDVLQPGDGLVEVTEREAGLREENVQRRAHRRRRDGREQRVDTREGAMIRRLDGVIDGLGLGRRRAAREGV